MREWGGVCKEMFTCNLGYKQGEQCLSLEQRPHQFFYSKCSIFNHVIKTLTDSVIVPRLFPTLVFFSHALRCASSCASTVTATSSRPWATSLHRGSIRALGRTSWRRWNVTWKTGTLGQRSRLLETAGDNREVTPGQIMTWKKKKRRFLWTKSLCNVTQTLYVRLHNFILGWNLLLTPNILISSADLIRVLRLSHLICHLNKWPYYVF